MAGVLFYIFSAVAVLFALLVVYLRNPVTSALSLVVSFFAVSGMFVLLSAPFVGVIQIMVYVGAILVLFLYVTMLLNLGTTEVTSRREKQIRAASFLVLPVLFYLLLRFVVVTPSSPAYVTPSFGTLESVSEKLLSDQALLFEVISVLLLAGIVGAVVISTRDKKEGRA